MSLILEVNKFDSDINTNLQKVFFQGIKPPVLKIKSNHSDLFVQNSGMPRIPQIELNDLINIAEDRINERFYITEPSILSSGELNMILRLMT